MRAIFSLTLYFIALIAGAQDESHEIRLYDGTVLSGERLIYEHPILKQPYFSLDGKRYETSDVAYFRNNHGSFANLKNLSGSQERYALRVKSGTISLYEEIDIHLYGADRIDLREADPGSTSPLLAKGEALEYYSKLDGPVQQARYKFLKLDLADNAGSLTHLRYFRRYRSYQGITLGAGLGLSAASLAMNDEGRAQFTPLTALGMLIAGSAYFFEYPKRDAIYNAIDAYNK